MLFQNDKEEEEFREWRYRRELMRERQEERDREEHEMMIHTHRLEIEAEERINTEVEELWPMFNPPEEETDDQIIK